MADPTHTPSGSGRPAIDTLKSGDELRRWYWRKDELVPHARALGLKVSGGKFELLDRIVHFLDTGEPDLPGTEPSRPTSKFDWHRAPLSDDTRLTDNYRNTQNVRRYFKSRLGDGFKFNIAFMDWMKTNSGKTLADACEAYPTLLSAPGQTRIKDHNQFNQYTRDFLADNPALGMDDVRRVWALKIQLRSEDGRHRYCPSDLDLKEAPK